MDITLLLIAIALLDVAMIRYSLYLDRQIAKLKNTGTMAGKPFTGMRMGRFERFAHSPMGTTLLAVCFIGSLIAMKEAEKHADAGHSTVETVPENPLLMIPCADDGQGTTDGQPKSTWLR